MGAATSAPVHLFHVGTPSCWWTYGYLGVLGRVRAVYGDQVAIHEYIGCVYEDRDGWIEHEELTDEGLNEWAEESAELMGVPLTRFPPLAEHPQTMKPATDATWAAYGQGRAAGDRFMRELLTAWSADGRDPNDTGLWDEAVIAAGLDTDRFRSDLDDPDALDKVAAEMGAGFPHVGLGFYNLAIGDGEDTWVVLNHAFDAARVEQAIEFIGQGALKRTEPTDIPAYLRDNGACSPGELAKVFARPMPDVQDQLGDLEEQGSVRATPLKAGTFWTASR